MILRRRAVWRSGDRDKGRNSEEINRQRESSEEIQRQQKGEQWGRSRDREKRKNSGEIKRMGSEESSGEIQIEMSQRFRNREEGDSGTDKRENSLEIQT